MTRVLVAPEADEALREIFRYTLDRWGEEQARAYLERIRDACAQLTDHPGVGRFLRRIRDAELRQLQGESHVVVYAVRPEGVVILAVLHEAMDLPRRRRALVLRMRAKGLL